MQEEVTMYAVLKYGVLAAKDHDLPIELYETWQAAHNSKGYSASAVVTPVKVRIAK